MSERLEIIKFLRNSEKTVAPGMQPSDLISRKDVDWLINRVEELELEVGDWRAEVQKWQKFYKESEENHLETKELLKNIVNQNKRYREALKNIYELAEYDEYDNTLEQIVSEIEKVLESDEN
jgi:DNA-binding ferritin-like protein